MYQQMKGPPARISEQTWQRYVKNRDIGLRNEILMAYLPIVTFSLKKAQSFIRNRADAEDMAEEMTTYTKNNILLQASQAMLAQANSQPQGVLQLLQQ